MPPLSDGHFLHPSDRVESPCFEIRGNRFFDPTNGAAAILLTPDVDVLGVSQAGGINVIESHREERLAFWRDQPPAIFPLPKCEEATRFSLSCLALLGLGSLRVRCHGQPCCKGGRLSEKLASMCFVHLALTNRVIG